MFLLELKHGGASDYAADFLSFERLQHLKAHRPGLSDLQCLAWLAMHPPMAGSAGSFSGYVQTHVMDHVNGKTAWTMPAVVALALTTATPDSTKTGATITEPTYTGYNRPTIAGAGFNAAVQGTAGNPSTASNNGVITGGNDTSGSGTIIGWALLDSATIGAGNMLWWGTATSTNITTTQTPPTVNSGGLTESLL